MKIKFTKHLTLIDGEGKYYSFKEGKTYELADYWALQLINSGEVVAVGSWFSGISHCGAIAPVTRPYCPLDDVTDV